MTSLQRPVVGVGAIVWKNDHVLLIQRGKAPGYGRWSIPGGHLEFGETCPDGALRELKEETGISAEHIGLVDVYDALPKKGAFDGHGHFVLINYCMRWLSGEPIAASDVMKAEWVTLTTMKSRGLWQETEQAIIKSQSLFI